MHKKHIRLESINILFCGVVVLNMILTLIMFISFIIFKSDIFFYVMLILLGSSITVVSGSYLIKKNSQNGAIEDEKEEYENE